MVTIAQVGQTHEAARVGGLTLQNGRVTIRGLPAAFHKNEEVELTLREWSRL